MNYVLLIAAIPLLVTGGAIIYASQPRIIERLADYAGIKLSTPPSVPDKIFVWQIRLVGSIQVLAALFIASGSFVTFSGSLVLGIILLPVAGFLLLGIVAAGLAMRKKKT